MCVCVFFFNCIIFLFFVEAGGLLDSHACRARRDAPWAGKEGWSRCAVVAAAEGGAAMLAAVNTELALWGAQEQQWSCRPPSPLHAPPLEEEEPSGGLLWRVIRTNNNNKGHHAEREAKLSIRSFLFPRFQEL